MLVLLLVLSLQVPASGLSTRPNFNGLTFTPAVAKVGDKVAIAITARSEGSWIIRGEVVLESPSGKQMITVPVTRGVTGPTATFTVRPGMEPGKWAFHHLTLVNDVLESITIRRGAEYTQYCRNRDYEM
ncbi:MAG: hypothetical protein K0R39_465, partial [Symbiobacteriaceae bacterium]|nr:hypothetical protein [Symbiobacteriaceae bacterium]